jgi:hypothetical protein
MMLHMRRSAGDAKLGVAPVNSQLKRHSEQFQPDLAMRRSQAPGQGVARQEAVMSDANVFRQFAEEALRGSSEAIDQDEKRALEKLACTWAQAALLSDRVFGFALEPVEHTSRR